jgi:DNA-binding transcriptional MocR family regulator
MDISNQLQKCNIDTHSRVPLYLQIASFLTNLIQHGELTSGIKLPPERELATLLGVSRTTAINVYRQLEKQGLVTTKIGSGTYVSATSPTHTPTPNRIPWSQLFTPHMQTAVSSLLKDMVSASPSLKSISLAAGMPDPHLYPLEVFQQLYSDVHQHTVAADFGHIATEGYMPLRIAITQMLADKHIAAPPEHSMILSGSQQGLYLVSKVFLEPGDYVIVESPTYLGAIQTFQSAGARLLKIPVTERLDLDLIEDYLIRYRPKLFYILPTYQNPTGRCLTAAERLALLELAARYRLVIVEDDPYSSLYYGQQPPLPLKAYDQYGGVIHVGTFSKVLFPGLRIGWLVAPPEVIQRMALEKQYLDLHSNNLAQLLLHRYLSADKLPAHLDHIRTVYKQRRNIMAKALQHYCGDFMHFQVPQGGFYFWGTIKSELSTHLLLHEAVAKGVTFVPGEAFYQTPAPTNQLRLCFVTHDESTLIEGIKRLASVIKQTRLKSGSIPPAHPSVPII